MIVDYQKMLEEVISQLNAQKHTVAIALVSMLDEIRGYGHVK